MKPDPLPQSDDAYWEGERYSGSGVKVSVCASHKDWTHHVGYIDNKDGTASCTVCGWGFRIPGFMRVHEGRVYDLRRG